MVNNVGVLVHRQNKRFLSLTISIVCLLIFFALALQIATSKSPTADESMHLLRGAVLWQTGNLELQGNHLPFSHWLIGSLLFTEHSIPDVTSLPSWSLKAPIELAQEFLWQSSADVSRVILLGRIPILFIGLLLGAVLSWWSFIKTGLMGQAITMVLFAFSPNLLALSSLATTDTVTVVMIVVALLLVWRFYNKPTAWRWLFAALALGLALSTKLSSAIILPSTLVLAYIDKGKDPWWKPAALWSSLLPVAGFVVWSMYGFEVGPVEGLPFALPGASYISSVMSITGRFNVGKSAYLLGERSVEGWWHYFVIAYLVKTPSITLILVFLAVFTIIRQRHLRSTAYLWFPALALFGAASYSRFNIGYRHILAIVPLTWLLIAESSQYWRDKPKARLVLIAALACYAILALRQQPDQLAYFNEFIGGSSKGQSYLGDSNIDWGQDLHLLANYAGDLEDGPLFVSYFGASDPAYYGLKQAPLFDSEGYPTGFAPANPQPGKYAISVNHIQGATASEPDLFYWFKRLDPVASLGYSILIYDVPSDLDGEWLAHCYDPLPIVKEEEAEQLVGRDDLRHVYFDCRSSWVLPGGDQPGWYLLPADLDPTLIDEQIANNLALVFANVHGSRYSPFHAYYWSGTSEHVLQPNNSQGAVTFLDGQQAELPLLVGDIAQLEGGLINGSIWGSIWQTILQTDLPISIMLHLYGNTESPNVADGLGFQPVQWLPGDIFIQFHDYEDVSGSYLETSLYDVNSGERHVFEGDGSANTTARFFPKKAP